MTDAHRLNRALKEWEQAAVMGLNRRSSVLDRLDPSLQAHLPDETRGHPARRFLDALSLSLFSTALARLPAREPFDELPPLPEVSLSPVPEAWQSPMQRALEDTDRQMGLLFLLHRCGYALPDSSLLPLLNGEHRDRQFRALIAQTLSARGRWLVSLNEAWQGVRTAAESADLDDLPAFARSQRLNAVFAGPPEAILGFVRTQWAQVTAPVRLQLLRWLRMRTADPQVVAFLEEVQADTSLGVRWALQCILSQLGRGEARSPAIALVSRALGGFRTPVKRRSIQVTLPSQEDPDLRALPLSGRVADRRGLSEAAATLGQLVVLAGPQALADLLGMSLRKTFAALARSHFRRELASFLLEAAIQHESLDGVAAWLAAYGDPFERLPETQFVAILTQGNPRFIPPVLRLVASQHGARLASPSLWAALFSDQIECDAALTGHLLPGLLQTLEAGKRPKDRQRAFLLAPLVHLSTAHTETQRSLAEAGEEASEALIAWSQMLAFRRECSSEGVSP